jgi:hypothetical protein
MKKGVILFILANMLWVSASAQMVPRPRRECTQRCITMDYDNPRKSKFEEKLKQIREKKKGETDSAKLQELEQAEEQAIEDHKDDLEKMCTTICSHNPDD